MQIVVQKVDSDREGIFSSLSNGHFVLTVLWSGSGGNSFSSIYWSLYAKRICSCTASTL